MSFSLSRLTLYGLISTLEADLRSSIRRSLLPGTTLITLLTTELYARAKVRAESDGYESDDEILEYIDFGDAISILNRHSEILGTRFQKFLKQETATLQGIISVRNRVMHSRPLVYSDVGTIDILVSVSNRYTPDILPACREFSNRIKTDPYFPFSLDVSELERHHDTILHNLPIPDFDETGFLGRGEEARQLLQACKGPWPLITVVGEGGSGKTALALKVAYELLDDQAQPFECIVWSTSKSTRLTLNEIEHIEGSITTSLGLFEDIAKSLGEKNASDPLVQVRNYLNEFKILLIIDNLETILDKRVLDFFASLTGKSKILVTSRVGTGAMNYPFPIGSLSDADAVQLLRATARSRRVPDLAKVKTDLLRSYCKRMRNNPGFIKWFVSVVQCGKRPEDALADPSIFLDFCLSNVYEYTSPDARKIANAMLSVPGKHAQPTLSYLTELEADQFQLALQSLWSANVVSMSNVATETGYVTIYELNELPRQYIMKNHAPSSREISRYQLRRREINAMHEALQANRNRDRYDIKNITRRTNDDTVLSKYLSDAIAASKDNILLSSTYVEKAKKLDPSFFEVHRVDAFVKRWEGNRAAAWEAYENAIACEPRHAPLRFWYGNFLLHDNDDLDGAHTQFQLAAEIDPTSPQVQLELGRTYIFMGDFELADGHIYPLITDTAATLKLRRKAFDAWIQSAHRRATQCFGNGDYVGCVDAHEHQVERYNLFARELADERIILARLKQIPALENLLTFIGQTNEAKRVRGLISALREIHLDNSSVPEDNSTDSSQVGDEQLGASYGGTIQKYDASKKFGFIVFDSGKLVFFHQSNFVAEAPNIHAGQTVEFVIVKVDERYKASQIRAIASAPPPSTPQRGIVKNVLPEKRFGFIYSESEDDLFFHISNLLPGVGFSELLPGTRVLFTLGSNDKGPIADKVQLDQE